MAKMRSPNYPAVSLSQAIEAVRMLYDKEHDTDVLPENAAKAIGYQSLSGPARTKIAAMKHYGLLQDGRQGVKVSPLALRILMPSDENEKKEAIREAATIPSLFKELLENMPNASDDSLVAYLVRQRRFIQDGARMCVKAYRDTMSLAGLPSEGYTPREKSKGEESGSMFQGSNRQPPTPPTTEAVALQYRLADDLAVEVRFTGNRAAQIEPLHLQLLSEQLDFQRKQMERLKKASPEPDPEAER